MGTVDAAPDNCQAGFYYQAGNNRIMPCGGGPASRRRRCLLAR